MDGDAPKAIEVEEAKTFFENAARRELSEKVDSVQVANVAGADIADPFGLMTSAELRAGQLLSLLSRDKSERVEVKVLERDQSGLLAERTKELSVVEAQEQLRRSIGLEIGLAVRAAEGLDQNAIAQLSRDNAKLIRELTESINSGTIRVDSTASGAELAKVFGPSPSDKQRQLLDAVGEREMLTALRHAESMVKMRSAALAAGGLTDPRSTLNRDGFSPTASEKLNAFALINQAERGSQDLLVRLNKGTDTGVTKLDSTYIQEMRNTKAVVNALVVKDLQDESRQIFKLAEEAKKFEAEGKFAQAETAHLQAAAIAEHNDFKFLARQLKDPHNRDNPQVGPLLAGIVGVAYEARVNAARFLIGQGKHDSALPLALKAGLDAPDFAQADSSYSRLMAEARFGKASNEGHFMSLLSRYERGMKDSNYAEAEAAIKEWRQRYQDTARQLEAGDAKLKHEEEKILKQLNALDGEANKSLVQDEKERLQSELALLRTTLESAKALRKEYGRIEYFAGVLAYSKGDFAAAEAHLNYVKANSPDIFGDERFQVKALLDMTAEAQAPWYAPKYLWKGLKNGLAIAAAVGAGVAVGALTVWTGPGAAVFGAGTTAALLTTMGIAGAGGFLAGGSAGYLTKSALDQQWASQRDFLKYGVVGGGSALGTSAASLFSLNLAPAATWSFSTAAGDSIVGMTHDGWSASGAATNFVVSGLTGTVAGVGLSRLIGGREIGMAAFQGRALANINQQSGLPAAMRQGAIGTRSMFLFHPTTIQDVFYPTVDGINRRHSPYKLPLLSHPHHYGLNGYDENNAEHKQERIERLNRYPTD